MVETLQYDCLPQEPDGDFDNVHFSRVLSLGSQLFDYSLDDEKKSALIAALEENKGVLTKALSEAPSDRRRAVDFMSNLCVLNDNIETMQQFGYDLVEENLPGIVEATATLKDYRQKQCMVDLMLRLSESNDTDKLASLTSHLHHLLMKELDNLPDIDLEESYPSVQYVTYLQYLRSFDAIFKYGDDAQVISTARTLVSRLEASSSAPEKAHTGQAIVGVVWCQKLERYSDNVKNQASTELMQYLVEHFGYDSKSATSLVFAWSDYDFAGHKHRPLENIKSNASAMLRLESATPGTAAILSNEFNIRLFAKYPPEVLRRQYEQRNDDTLPYVTVISATHDHNEVLSGPGWQGMNQSLHLSSEELGAGVRYYESGSIEKLQDCLEKTELRYGRNSMIGLIIAGHGTPSHIELGWAKKLTKEDVGGESPKINLVKYIKEGSSIALLSCSTGADGGIAQEVSKQGVRVLGPDKPTTGGLGLIRNSQGALELVEHFGGATTNVFFNGEKVSL